MHPGRLRALPRLQCKIIGVSSGPFHCLAWNKHGQLYSWGKAQYGCLGYEVPANNDYIVETPTLVPHLHTVEVLKACAGERHSLVLTVSGVVYSWGGKEIYSVD